MITASTGRPSTSNRFVRRRGLDDALAAAVLGPAAQLAAAVRGQRQVRVVDRARVGELRRGGAALRARHGGRAAERGDGGACDEEAACAWHAGHRAASR